MESESRDSILKNLTDLKASRFSEEFYNLPESDLQALKTLLYNTWSQGYDHEFSFAEYWSEEVREKSKREQEKRLKEIEQQGTRYSIYYHLKDEKTRERRADEHEWDKEDRAGVHKSSFPNEICVESDISLEECDRMLELYLERIVKPIKEQYRFFSSRLPKFVSREELL